MTRRNDTRTALVFRALVMLMIYVAVRYFGGAATQLLYPVIWLVAFLHELGHALVALITGGHVLSLQINPDGSGLTTTQGGHIGLILMGGYLGSALFGNFLFYIGARKSALSQAALVALAMIMIFAGIKWHTTPLSSALQIGFGLILLMIALRTTFDRDVLMFLGMASVLYVVQDFRVGPSSDLAMYETSVGIFPAEVWMYIWLGIVLLLTVWNLQHIFYGKPFATKQR
jgi:Peptidase M50B-like